MHWPLQVEQRTDGRTCLELSRVRSVESLLDRDVRDEGGGRDLVALCGAALCTRVGHGCWSG